jgi:hypothetical protein
MGHTSHSADVRFLKPPAMAGFADPYQQGAQATPEGPPSSLTPGGLIPHRGNHSIGYGKARGRQRRKIAVPCWRDRCGDRCRRSAESRALALRVSVHPA